MYSVAPRQRHIGPKFQPRDCAGCPHRLQRPQRRQRPGHDRLPGRRRCSRAPVGAHGPACAPVQPSQACCAPQHLTQGLPPKAAPRMMPMPRAPLAQRSSAWASSRCGQQGLQPLLQRPPPFIVAAPLAAQCLTSYFPGRTPSPQPESRHESCLHVPRHPARPTTACPPAT